MSQGNGSSRTINLDDDGRVQIVLEGREFSVKPARYAVVERVLLAVGAVEEGLKAFAGAEEVNAASFVQTACRNCQEQLPIFALILGHDEQSPEYETVLAHLKEHLVFSKARTVFEKWWEVNRIDDFFSLAGNLLIPAGLAKTRDLVAEVEAAAALN